MSRIFPVRNDSRIFPVRADGRIWPVPTAEAFFTVGGGSRFALLNETIRPFEAVTVLSGFTVTLAEYDLGAGWVTVSAGSHSGLLTALRNIEFTPTAWATPKTLQVRLTESGGEVRTHSVDIETRVRLATRLMRAPVNETVRPFARARFAETAAGLTAVQYEVTGAATVAKAAIPRAVIASGTHDGASNAAALADSTADLIEGGVEVGDTVANLTDGSEGAVTGRTATTITATLSGGTDNDWDAGDSYEVRKADDLRTRALQFEYKPTAAGSYILTLYANDGAAESSDSVRLEVA